MTTLLELAREAFALPDATTCEASILGGTAICGSPISRSEARAAGHPGFCSHECAIEDLENSAM